MVPTTAVPSPPREPRVIMMTPLAVVSALALFHFHLQDGDMDLLTSGSSPANGTQLFMHCACKGGGVGRCWLPDG
jgi:hypothetical protein